jgi:adenine-specific DNA-methyltransferase
MIELETRQQQDSIDLLDKEDLLKLLKTMINGGVTLNFFGKRSAMEIGKKVRPRVTRRVNDLHVGTPEEQSKNLLIEGENLQAMVTLYKFRGQVDLIVTDPPYNTGQNFRYNDKWDIDPNDPDLGALVTKDDGSRHTKWMKAMMPRLQMMKSMLKPQGVLAICIDENELFHLGMMLDEMFGEENRLAIINWQKSYSPKNDSRHVSSATEYVLVYAKDKTLAKTGLEPRTEQMDIRYTNPDNDPDGPWTSGDATSRDRRDWDRYGIQSPFTGAIFYPSTRSWVLPHARMKEVLEKWGSKYVEKDIGDGRAKAWVIDGAVIPKIPKNANFDENPTLEDEATFKHPSIVKARKKAEKIRENEVWPLLYFTGDGSGRPRLKRPLNLVKKGKVPMTYWADEDYDDPMDLGSQSWNHEESGHTQLGQNELNAVVGRGHEFDTVKPLRLIKKLIQIWCPPHGLVLDPYAGSGTTGHAVLELNSELNADRRFILIEQGRPEDGDKYARTLTWQRLHNAITGLRPDKNGKLKKTATPIKGGFEFRVLTSQIDAKTVLSMRRDELVDVVITSHWESNNRNSPNLVRIEDPKYKYLVGKNEQNEGYFIIWDGDGPVGQLDIETYRLVLAEGKKAELKAPYHVYARYEVYQSKNVYFYKIPDKILAHLGLNESSDPYNESEEE